MTRKVACVEPTQSLAAAAAVMATRKIRHLPVVKGGVLVGLLSQRDLLAARPSELELRRLGGISELELREPVSHAMTSRVFAVSADAPALEVARVLAWRRFGCAPVIDQDDHLIGIVTEADFLELAADALHRQPPIQVRALMQRDLVTSGADRPLADAEADMILRRVRHLPVIDDARRLIGLVSHRDVLRWRASVLESGGFRPDQRVADAMTREVMTVTPATAAEEAARIMLRHGFGSTPVVEDGRAVGIVTATDFLELLGRAGLVDEPRLTWNDLRVRVYMSSPLRRVAPDAPIEVAAELLGHDDTTCLAVVDGGRIAGLVTRSDLVEGAGPALKTLLPHDPSPVALRMTRGLIQVEASAPLVDACRAMIEHEVHQVVVVERGEPIGTLSRWDAIAAVRDLELASPIGEVATPITFTVGSREPIRAARSFLELADVSTVLVMEGRFPVGVFGKREAIRARDAAAGSAVCWAMNRAVLVLPADLALHHAAAQMLATGAQLVVVMRDGLAAGVLTATNFAEVLARPAA
jgi:CBS domain-containing membrane protein/CBS domain-containing protein